MLPCSSSAFFVMQLTAFQSSMIFMFLRVGWASAIQISQGDVKASDSIFQSFFFLTSSPSDPNSMACIKVSVFSAEGNV